MVTDVYLIHSQVVTSKHGVYTALILDRHYCYLQQKKKTEAINKEGSNTCLPMSAIRTRPAVHAYHMREAACDRVVRKW